MAATLRAFIALTIPETILASLSGMQRSMRTRGLKIGWVRPENIHLTLKFLGDIPKTAVPSVAGALCDAACGLPPVSLLVQGMGVFPGIKRPRVLWAGLGGDIVGLRHLFGRVEAALEPIGWAPDRRGFKAHLTLGRIRKPIDGQQLTKVLSEVGGYAPIGFTARRMVLFKSDLRPEGAAYTALSEIFLTTE
jgi:2'-5' RNA ligase